MATKWIGEKPKKCDICPGPIEGHFVDGKTIDGPWALMCLRCHKDIGVGLGIGKGQKYQVDTMEQVSE